MIKFLNILLIVFILLVIFYLYKIDYNQSFTSEENASYFYSGLIAVIAFIITMIVKSLHKLSIKK